MLSMDPVLGWTAALAAAAIFTASAALKAYDLPAFHAATASYRILPRWLEAPFAWTVPAVEGLMALALLIPAYRVRAALVLIVLLAAFTVAVVINLARGRTDLDCGCFGPALRQRLSGWLVARNGALFALLGAALTPAGERAMGLLDQATVSFAAATVVVLYVAMNYLIANAPGLRMLRAVND